MTEPFDVDVDELRDDIRDKYAAVVATPDGTFHFHTGRPLAVRLGYDPADTDPLPDAAIDSFAGVADPFALRPLESGENVVDLGSGAGLDAFIAGRAVGPTGSVIGVDMTAEMREKATATGTAMGADNVEFIEGYLEDLPIADEWADVVISNGVINLCPDKELAFAEAFRVLRPGGVLQFADIANTNPVPEEAKRQIDLWTG